MTKRFETSSHSRYDVDVAVVGGGIAGLVAARDLERSGLSALVLEKEEHSGGRIKTDHYADVYLEHGGIFHTRAYPAMRRFLAELGLADRVVASPSGFGSAVRAGGEWKHVNFGALTGPLWFRALTWKDRWSLLRTVLPALTMRPKDWGDLTSMLKLDTRSAAANLTKRAESYFTAAPHEFLWGTSTKNLSLAMLALQMHVFRGDLLEVRGGVGQLVERISEEVRVHHGCDVQRIERAGTGVTVHGTGKPGEVRARAVILACPATVSAKIWPYAPSSVLEHLGSITYSRIDYAYLRTAEPFTGCHGRKPTGLEVITTPEVRAGHTLGGIYYANRWAVSGGLLLATAAPVTGAANFGDDELADRLQKDVEELHPEIAGQVVDRVVMRHDPYVPVFGPGTISRLAAARQTLPADGVDLAGDHMAAPWVEGAVRSGQQAAKRMCAYLG